MIDFCFKVILFVNSLLYTLTLNLVHDRIIVSQMDFYID